MGEGFVRMPARAFALTTACVVPQEDENKPALDTWVIGPVLKMVGEFEESTKKYPLIPMDTPDPYRPPTGGK